MGTLALIYTVPTLIEEFKKLCSELIPDALLMHTLDESLLRMIQKRGNLIIEDSVRLRTHVDTAEKAGADVVLVTCSTLSPLVDEVQPHIKIPVIKIDEAMIHKAVDLSNTIGVIATAQSTLKPTCEALKCYAEKVGKSIEIDMEHVEYALEALMSGDGELHDELVKIAMRDLAVTVDVIILAQASMARVLDSLVGEDWAIPVLSSPHLALQHVRQYL